MTDPAPGRPELEPRIPLYLQVAQLVRQDVMAGKYRTGDMLPSERALTAAYGVSQATVRQAPEVVNGDNARVL